MHKIRDTAILGLINYLQNKETLKGKKGKIKLVVLVTIH